jgi:hypothetical protein
MNGTDSPACRARAMSRRATGWVMPNRAATAGVLTAWKAKPFGAFVAQVAEAAPKS